MVRGRAERLGKTIEETIPVVRRIRKNQDAFGFLGTFVAAFVVVLGFFWRGGDRHVVRDIT